MKKLFLFGLAFLLLFLFHGNAFSQSVLDHCADQFIDGSVANAPTIFSSPPDRPFGTNQHVCYREDVVSFFALEYWPGAFSPRWVAYRIAPDNYGPNVEN